MNYTFTINKERLQDWCDAHEVRVPEIMICTNIPVSDGAEPLGDYLPFVGRDRPAQIRIKLRLYPRHLTRDSLPRRMSDKKRVQICKYMNETLWHELRHHVQACTMHEFYLKGRTGDYYDRPIEKDARQYAKRAIVQQKPIIELTRGG